jgi:hypothetical protein
MLSGGGAALAELLHGMHNNILCGCYSPAIVACSKAGTLRTHYFGALHFATDLQQQERYWQHVSRPSVATILSVRQACWSSPIFSLVGGGVTELGYCSHALL